MQTKIAMLSLGCARNLVDAEVILGYLQAAGFSISEEIEDADIALVNTCAFIRQAEEESIDAILKLCQLKKERRISKIVVCGCLAQRYQHKLLLELKEVDAFVGVGSINKIVDVIKQLLAGQKPVGIFDKPQFLLSHLSPRLLLTPAHFSYVKISEGCSHRCSYCIIPALRGKHRSRTIESILQEVDWLFAQKAMAEINLIGQDTTMYGQDLYGKSRMAELLEKLAAKAKGRWLRLLYAHPDNFPQELIAVIRDNLSICKYIDLPIQHINDKILKKMRRASSKSKILRLLETLRQAIPGLAIRTTLIVGFPGETEREFKELLEFVREVRFERLGVFQYSPQENTPADNFRPRVPQKVQQSRYEALLTLQQDISTKINEGFLGKELTVLIDEVNEGGEHTFLGRSQYDAPEVDGCVYVQAKENLKAGDFVQVKITDTLEYDLVAELVKKQ